MNKLEQIKYIEENFPLYCTNSSKRKIRHDFFSKIETEIQAYLLGFYAADGNINEKRKTFRVWLNDEDSDIVNLYRDFISPNARLFRYGEAKSIARGKIITRRPTYGIDIASTRICNDLVKLGLGYRKTWNNNHIPLMDKSLIRHFIRGYFDGDGCITGHYVKAIKHHNERIRKCFEIDFKTKSMAEDMQREFIKHNISVNICYLKRDDMWRLSSSSIYTCNDIYHYLYDNSFFYGQRKYNKFSYYTNTEVSQLIADHRNAQKMNASNSNNSSTSAEHLSEMKMCAELQGNLKNSEIKSSEDNIIEG